jgi:hypothetical protein
MRRADLETELLGLGTTRAEPSPSTPVVLQGVPIAHQENSGCVRAAGEAATVEAVAVDVCGLANGRLPPELAAEMAMHGLTQADQLLLFHEGVTTVDGFSRLDDANMLASGIDMTARRRAKQLHDQREPRLHQVHALLASSGLTVPAREAIQRVAPDLDALRGINIHTMTELGIGIMDRATLLDAQEAWQSLHMPVVPTELERRAEVERKAAEVERKAAAKGWCYYTHMSVMLLLCGVVLQGHGWLSLYGDIGQWYALVGGSMALVGTVAFEKMPGHSAIWYTREYTAAERMALRRGKNDHVGQDPFVELALRFLETEDEMALAAHAKRGGRRFIVRFYLGVYAAFSVLTTWISARNCPTTQATEKGSDAGWVDWSERCDDGGRWVVFWTVLSLVFFLWFVFMFILGELGRMR